MTQDELRIYAYHQCSTLNEAARMLDTPVSTLTNFYKRNGLSFRSKKNKIKQERLLNKVIEIKPPYVDRMPMEERRMIRHFMSLLLNLYEHKPDDAEVDVLSFADEYGKLFGIRGKTYSLVEYV